MFIENVPEVYINSPDKLEVGMKLWRTGQGGISRLAAPKFLGSLVLRDWWLRLDGTLEPAINFMVVMGERCEVRGYSMRDHHIVPQTYNNWYICSSQADASIIHEHLRERSSYEYLYS